MKTLSVLMPVYNEDELLPLSLGSIIDTVDEIVIVDGNEKGPSTDGTKSIIDGLNAEYGGKITYLSGSFAMPDGRWDAAAQRNLGLSHITSKYMMLMDADEAYHYKDIYRLYDTIIHNQDKKLFYCNFLELFWDTDHMRIGGSVYPTLPASNTIVVDMELSPSFGYEDDNLFNGGAMRHDTNINRRTEILYVPQVIRYHYGWVKPFDQQVNRHVRNVRLGGWGEFGNELIAQGDIAIYRWAIDHVLKYPEMECYYPYYGNHPAQRKMSCLRHYNEAMLTFEDMFGKGFTENG